MLDKAEYYAKYYQNNKDRIKSLNKKRYEERRSTPEGLQKHKERSLLYTKKYRESNPDKVTKSRKSQYTGRRLKALEMIGGASCVYCGCDVLSFLEINHKNGDGCKEWKKMGAGIVDRLLNGTRSTDGLEVACRVCNNLHYLQLKDPIAASGFKVIWTGKKAVHAETGEAFDG
jgi:hypothetical protein